MNRVCEFKDMKLQLTAVTYSFFSSSFIQSMNFSEALLLARRMEVEHVDGLAFSIIQAARHNEPTTQQWNARIKTFTKREEKKFNVCFDMFCLSVNDSFECVSVFFFFISLVPFLLRYSLFRQVVCIDNVSLSSEWHSDDGCLPIFFPPFSSSFSNWNLFFCAYVNLYTCHPALDCLIAHKVCVRFINKMPLFNRLHSPSSNDNYDLALFFPLIIVVAVFETVFAKRLSKWCKSW